jgi:hypothetical protein
VVCDEEDNDCDGMVDEGFSGHYEYCDGVDNNCDGRIDEELTKRRSCVPEGAEGDWIFYDTDFTSCRRGWQACTDGYWHALDGICDGFVGPSPEICDGLDNDCNGVTDDVPNLGACGLSEVGQCRYGVDFCIEGEVLCLGAAMPQNETCDNADNNCNGEIDEELSRICETACERGIESCAAGDWVGCTARVPVEELCDDEDNDCDNRIDEGLNCSCNYGDMRPCLITPCGWGVKTCLEGGFWSLCEGETSQPEICNAHDDNCNDQVDEGLVRECYDGEEGTIDVGICVLGESTCSQGSWSLCMEQQTPEEERCDGLDNDCDGDIDNMERVFEKVDLVFVIDFSGSMDDYIIPVIDGIETYTTSLTNNEHRFGIVAFGYFETGPGGYVGQAFLHSQLTTLENFIDRARSIVPSGGIEPSLDAIHTLANPENTLSLAWRSNATPIVILITDEVAQSNMRLSAADLIPYTHVCQLPGCNSQTNENWIDGDPLEMFAFLDTQFYSPWTTIISAEGSRLFDITRLQAEGTLSADLQLLFTDICID